MGESVSTFINGFVYKWITDCKSNQYVKLTYPMPDLVIAIKHDKPSFFNHDGYPDSTFQYAVTEKGNVMLKQIPAVLEFVDGKDVIHIDYLKATTIEVKQ